MIGKTISHYKILERIGGGGMGVVYKAEDTKLKRPVALKFLPPAFATDPTTKERFIHEAQSASALDHTNICNIFEIGETEDGQLFISMAYYEGETLKQKLESGKIDIDTAIDYTIQIAKGLLKAHEKNIIHRDIKPDNVIITHDGEAKILDFGLAKFRGQTKITKTGSTLGTVAYMSPEQAKGEEVDQRTDIWSLGVMLYEMVTGELPFKGDYDQAVVYSILNEEPESLVDVPSGLQGIIETALSKKPEERYQNIDELMGDLKVIGEESGEVQKIRGKRIRAKGKRQTIKYIFYSIILMLVLSAAYLTVQTLSGKEIKPIPIAVISFDNQTGDPANDYLHEAIAKLLITNLEQSKFFHVNPWERMKDLLEQTGQKDATYIDVNLGSQLCQIDQIPLLVTGSVFKIGNIYSIEAKIYDSQTKRIIHNAKSQGEGANSIIKNQIDDLAEQIAVELDLPEREFAESKKPFIDVTTNSIEAYKYYLLGGENYYAGYDNEAKTNFIKAIDLDSTFTMAHLGLAFVYWREGSSKEMNLHLDLAKKYRYKLTRKEQIRLDFAYDRRKGNDLSQSITAMKKATSLYPKEKEIYLILGDHYYYRGDVDTAITYLKKAIDLDPNCKPALQMIGYSYMKKRDYTKALQYFQKYIDVNPNEAGPYDSMGDIYLYMNKFEKSIEMYQKALEIKPDFGSQRGIVSNYIKMRDYQKARNYLNQWNNVTSSDGDRRSIHNYLAITYIAEDNLNNTLKELEDSDEILKQKSRIVGLAYNQLAIADILYESGRIKEAEEKLTAGKDLIENSDLSEETKHYFRARYNRYMTQLAVIKGNLEQAKEYAEMYNQEIEKDKDPNLIKWNYTLSGLIAYAEGDYEKAIDELKRSNLNIPFNNYHLAMAYLKTGNKSETFKKLENVVNYVGFPDLTKELYRNRAEQQLARLKTTN